MAETSRTEKLLARLDNGATFVGYPEGFGESWQSLARDAANEIRRLTRLAAKPADEGAFEVLQRYGRHDDGCVAEPWHGKGPIRCSCGYSDALSTTGEPKR